MPSRDISELWFATRRRPWKSLCLVPAAPGTSAVPLAEALTAVGQLISRGSVTVVRAEAMDLSQIADFVARMTGQEPATTVWTASPGRAAPQGTLLPTGPGAQLLIAVDSVIENPLMLPVVLSADQVLLVVELGKTDLEAAQHTVNVLGRERILGAVLVSPGKRRSR